MLPLECYAQRFVEAENAGRASLNAFTHAAAYTAVRRRAYVHHFRGYHGTEEVQVHLAV
jgi:hypothetical protein